MKKVFVLNASPIIALAKIERLDLLLSMCHSVLVPKGVADEVLSSPSQDPARQALESGWGAPYVEVTRDPEVIEWGLGAGETEVLSLARQKRATAVVDDRAARVACKVFGIPVIGTLGIVLQAYVRQLIPSAVEVLKVLKKAGFYLDDDLIRKVLESTTQEEWPE